MREVLSGIRKIQAEKFIGREAEKRKLDAALARAVRFEAPQFVTLIGTEGVGKSRFLTEWLHTLDEGKVFQTYFSCPKGALISVPPPFSLVQSLLRSRFGISPDDDEATIKTVLFRELHAVFHDRRISEMASLLGVILGFKLDESPLGSSLNLRPQQQWDLARAVLCRFLEQDGRTQPLLFVVDDAHLADDESLEMFCKLSAELGETCIVFVFAGRPEILIRRPEWNHLEGSHVRLELGPLAPLEIPLFVQSALGSGTVEPALIERIAQESGGNPSYLERLLGEYQERGILTSGNGGTWHFDKQQAEQELIPRGDDSFTPARVAGLTASEKNLLARAAALGSIFWSGALVALGRMEATPWDPTLVFASDPSIEEIRRILESLAARGYLRRAETNPLPCDTAWTFSDPSAMSLLATNVDPEVSKRNKRFIAQWIEARVSESNSCESLERVAQLYEEGGDLRRAGRRYVTAGDYARHSMVYERARALYSKAIELFELDDALLSIETLHKLGDVTARLGRNREAIAHFGEMLKLAWRLDLPSKAGAAHGRIGRIHRAIGDYSRALQHLDMAHLLFDLSADRPGVAATLDDIGRVNFLTGKLEEALRCHKTALSIRAEIKDERGMALTHSWIGLAEAQMGELDVAQENLERSLIISQSAQDSHRIVFSLLDLGSLAQEAGHPELAQSLLEKARNLSLQMGEPLHECHLALQIGAALLAQRHCEEARNEYEKAKNIAQKFGAQRLLAESDLGLAEVELRLGSNIEAERYARAALTAAETMGAVYLAGSASRILAESLTEDRDVGRVEARELFDQSMKLLGSCHAAIELSRTFLAYADLEESLGHQEVAESLRDRAYSIRRRARIEVQFEGIPICQSGSSTEVTMQ
jgi:tetratricopeptide (TPR) repeat protein